MGAHCVCVWCHSRDEHHWVELDVLVRLFLGS